MQLYLIRHAESQNNALYARNGSSKGRHYDPPLTEVGEEQARRLADFLRASAASPDRGESTRFTRISISLIYTSLMTRAVVTATAAAQALGVPLIAWRDLHESGGLYLEDEISGARIGQPGPNRAHFSAYFPQLTLPDDLGADGWWNRAYEEPAERPGRAGRVWETLLERYGSTNDRIALVTHAGFYNHLLAIIFKIPDKTNYWFALNNVAITRLEVDARGVALLYANRFDFLPPEFVTL